MNGKLSQMLSLIEFGNAFIQNGNAKNRQKDSMMQYIESINFVLVKQRLFSTKFSEIAYASNPEEWHKRLSSEGCLGYRLILSSSNAFNFSEQFLSNFGSTGHDWYIETLMGKYSFFWLPQWLPAENATKPRNKWSVRYSCLKKAKTRPFRSGIREAREELRNKLIEVSSFATENGLHSFNANFQGALTQLDYRGILGGELALPDLSKRTLDACRLAYVFGGMGSWSDKYFQGKRKQQRLEILSEELYVAIERAIVSATNELAQNR